MQHYSLTGSNQWLMFKVTPDKNHIEELNKTSPTIISAEQTQIIKLHALSQSVGFFLTVSHWISLSLSLSCSLTLSLSLSQHTHTHAYIQYTLLEVFITEKALILLSALTNKYLAPWNIWFACWQSRLFFPQTWRVKLEGLLSVWVCLAGRPCVCVCVRYRSAMVCTF